MTLFAVAFFVIAALVLILGLMMRPLAYEPRDPARKWAAPLSMQIGYVRHRASTH